LRKKLKLALDSLTGFDHALVRAMTYLGFLVALAGFALAIYVVVHAVGGEPPTGWSSMMIAILILGGAQMVFLGVLGEYAWRTLDETRGRPLYVVEASTDADLADDARSGARAP
jgi:dolichol-phosphate mannosyltransferase